MRAKVSLVSWLKSKEHSFRMSALEMCLGVTMSSRDADPRLLFSFPGGENIVMNCVFGGASKNLLIKQKEVVLSTEHIIPGSLYACSYDDEWYFGVANYISVENYDVNIKFLKPNIPAAQFFRPSLEGSC